MKKNLFILLILFVFLLLVSQVNIFAEESVFSIGEIKVTDKLLKPAKQSGDLLFRGITLDNNSLKVTGESGTNSIYNSLSILPDINLDADDPFGLGDKKIRLRGTSDYFLGVTVEGVPNYGIMPIGPRDYIYDVENFKSLKVYSGSTPSDLMTGSGNRGGAVESVMKRPNDKFNLFFKQSAGSFSYSKTFLRIDSGRLFNSDAKFYTSLSYTDADKWKGNGKLGPRKNITLGFSKKIFNLINIDFFVNYNSINRNFFKGLSYKEAKNMDDFYYHDYNSYKIGNPLDDCNYYGYNKFSSINRDYFAFINFNINKNIKVSLKPYYSKEENSKYQGMKFGNFAFVLNKLNDSKRYGLISEINFKKNNFESTLGYWHEITDFKPIIKKFGISSKGLVFKGYSWYTKQGSDGKVLSPYFKAGYNFGKVKLQGGIKYFYYKEPSKRGFWYKNGSLIYDPTISISEKSYNEFLPSFGIEYSFNKILRASISYSKKYQRPYAYGPLSSFYFKNYQVFKNQNIKLEKLFDGLDMETVDAFDMNFMFDFKNASLTTTLFYQKHHNILVALNDPAVNLAYQQNDGEAQCYGFEVTGEINYTENFKIFSNLSFNKMEFTKNINKNGKVYHLDGKQFPDSPKFMFKTGLVYNYKGFEFIPIYKYIGKRYGDALNNEQINSYSLINLQLNYKYKKVVFGLEIDNLFNHKHIGRIDTWDDATGSATYYSASPFTMVAKISLNF